MSHPAPEPEPVWASDQPTDIHRFPVMLTERHLDKFLTGLDVKRKLQIVQAELEAEAQL